MKNKFIMFFTYSLFFSVNGYCQFNTVLQKKDIPKAEPVLATTENKLIDTYSGAYPFTFRQLIRV